MLELLGDMRERRMEVSKSKLACSLLILVHKFILLDGFQWSIHQQANHVVDVVVGSDVSLPCDYELTSQEQQEASIFHLLTWTREEPINSGEWAGLAVRSTLTGSKVIYDNPQRIFIINNTLTVRNVAVKDHTQYQCAFQSSFFTTPSIIQLNVQYPPEITIMPSSQEVKEGFGVTLVCNASGNPRPKITWTKQGSNTVLSTAETLSLNNLVREDDGSVYICNMQNNLGSQQANATIAMLYKPKDTQLTISSSKVKPGETLDITCTANSKPSPEYKFYHGRKLIRWSSNGVLSLDRVKTEDEGTYRCVPNNNLGEGPEAEVTVTVDDNEGFPLWGYIAIAGGLLFIVLIIAVIAVCRLRTSKKESDERGKLPQAKKNPLRPTDAREAHVGPGAFYGDYMNGGTEIPHLNGAVSFSDIRTSRGIPAVKGAVSADDVRMGEIPAVKGAFSANDVRFGETAFSRLDEAYPTRSVMHLITGAEEAVSQL